MRFVALLFLGAAYAPLGQAQPAANEPQLPQERAALLLANAARAGAETAVTPLEVRPAEPGFAGKLLLDRHPIDPPAIAAQTIVPVGAARATLGRAERLLPLSIVGKLQPGEAIPTDMRRRAWCNGKEERGSTIRCYQDLDGDGQWEVARWGDTYSDDSPFTLYMVGKAEPISPIPYRLADPAELPAMQLIYQGCRVTDRIQYSVRIGVKGDGDVKTWGCPAAAQPIGKSELTGPGRYRVDRVTVDIAYATPSEATAMLVEGIAGGTLLDRIDVGKPVRLLGERKGWPIEQAELRLRYERPPYLFVGAPLLTQEGGEGAALLAGSYRYGYTARVVGDVEQSKYFGGKKPAFAAGDALYGLPMHDPTAPQIFGEPVMMWCAPREKKPGVWRANCLQQQDVTRGVYSDVFNALWIEQIPATGSNSDAIEIEEGPVDLPQASVRYDFWKWSPRRLFLRRVVSLNGVAMPAQIVEVPRLKEGPALLAIAGGVLRVEPGADGTGFKASVLRRLLPDASAQPKAGLMVQFLDMATRDGRPLTTDEKADLLMDGASITLPAHMGPDAIKESE